MSSFGMEVVVAIIACLVAVALTATPNPTELYFDPADATLCRGLKDDEVDSNDRLIVRRGDTFTLGVTSSGGGNLNGTYIDFRLRPYDPIADKPLKFDPIEVPLSKISTCDSYCTYQGPQNDATNKSVYNLFMPVLTPIALYAVDIALHVSDDPTSVKYFTVPNRLIVLFNPWNPADDVYMSDVKGINEYVMNEDGMSWVGSEDEMSPITWDHAQFSQAPLDVALWALQDMPGKKFQKQEGVKYGQCWVFAGILTTAGRTLGIPARSITNFASAHEEGKDDGKYTLRIDTYFEANGTYLGMEGSIWNFHQWTEFYFKRNDIGTNNSLGGWQTVDATPQETSAESGLYQLGPASVNGIKAREADNYDNLFVISEVDAGLYKWIRKNTGKEPSPKYKGFYLMEVDDEAIGQKISTKQKGVMKREDVTSAYKSTARAALLDESRVGLNKITSLASKDVTLKIVPPRKGLFVGRDLVITVTAVCNVCNDTNHRLLAINSVLSSVTYRGHDIKNLKTISQNLTLTDSDPLTTNISLDCEEYEMALSDGQGFQYSSTALIYTETESGTWNATSDILNKFGQFSLSVVPPVISSTQLNSTTFILSVTYENPLTIPLTNVLVRISGSGIKNLDITLQDLGGEKTFEISPQITVRPFASKEVVVNVKVLTNELSNINSYVTVNLQ